MRRRFGSGLLAAYLLTLVLANVGVEPAQRVAGTLGLDQPWDVFAPEPLQYEVELAADVLYSDQTREVWRPPRRSAALAPLGYRFEEWSRQVALDGESELWRPAAEWIARRHARSGRSPLTVVLRRRWRPVPRPGQQAAHRIWTEFEFYTLKVSAGA